MGGSSSSGGRAVGGRRINPNNRDATQATLAAGRRIGSATGARSANAAERQALANAGVRITDRGFTTRDGRLSTIRLGRLPRLTLMRVARVVVAVVERTNILAWASVSA